MVQSPNLLGSAPFEAEIHSVQVLHVMFLQVFTQNTELETLETVLLYFHFYQRPFVLKIPL